MIVSGSTQVQYRQWNANAGTVFAGSVSGEGLFECKFGQAQITPFPVPIGCREWGNLIFAVFAALARKP